MKERLQKIFSARGVCSRRKAEEYIRDGLVKINGKVASLGDKADPEVDRIEVDGKIIEERKEMLYYVMNKPVGVVTTNVEGSHSASRSGSEDPSGSRTTSSWPRGKLKVKGLKQSNIRPSTFNLQRSVHDLLPKTLQGKIFPIGRLDKDSSGLLLFTNDGVLAYRLTHPKFHHEKEYQVRVEKPIPDGVFKKLRQGVKVLGSKTKPAKVKRLSARRFTITLTEGRNRQIRRMCQKVGFPVRELKRIRIVTLSDVKLAEGKVRSLTLQEKMVLLKAVGL